MQRGSVIATVELGTVSACADGRFGGYSTAARHRGVEGVSMDAAVANNLINAGIGAALVLLRGRIVAGLPNPAWRPTLDRILLVGGLSLAVSGILLALHNLTEPPMDPQLEVMRINASAPAMLDDQTRFEEASVAPGRRIVFHLTLVSLKAEDIDRAAWRANVVPTLRASILPTPAVQRLLAGGLTVSFRYSSSDRILIDELVFWPEQAGNH